MQVRQGLSVETPGRWVKIDIEVSDNDIPDAVLDGRGALQKWQLLSQLAELLVLLEKGTRVAAFTETEAARFVLLRDTLLAAGVDIAV